MRGKRFSDRIDDKVQALPKFSSDEYNIFDYIFDIFDCQLNRHPPPPRPKQHYLEDIVQKKVVLLTLRDEIKIVIRVSTVDWRDWSSDLNAKSWRRTQKLKLLLLHYQGEKGLYF